MDEEQEMYEEPDYEVFEKNCLQEERETEDTEECEKCHKMVDQEALFWSDSFGGAVCGSCDDAKEEDHGEREISEMWDEE